LGYHSRLVSHLGTLTQKYKRLALWRMAESWRTPNTCLHRTVCRGPLWQARSEGPPPKTSMIWKTPWGSWKEVCSLWKGNLPPSLSLTLSASASTGNSTQEPMCRSRRKTLKRRALLKGRFSPLSFPSLSLNTSQHRGNQHITWLYP
jgi:hypothetical protein